MKYFFAKRSLSFDLFEVFFCTSRQYKINNPSYASRVLTNRKHVCTLLICCLTLSGQKDSLLAVLRKLLSIPHKVGGHTFLNLCKSSLHFDTKFVGNNVSI